MGEVINSGLYGVKERVSLKNLSRFALHTEITMWFDGDVVYETATLDLASKKIVNMGRTEGEEASFEKGTYTIRLVPGWNDGTVYSFLDLGEDSGESPIDNQIHVNLYTPGEKIHRMKGSLMLKSQE